jgi:hypothetical protein
MCGWNDRPSFLKGELNVRSDGLSRQKGNGPASDDGLDIALPPGHLLDTPSDIARAIDR